MKAENSIKQQIQAEVDQMDKAQVWTAWEGLRMKNKEVKVYTTCLKEKLISMMGKNDSLELVDGAGVYWRPKYFKEVPVEVAMRIIEDEDQMAQVMKVDMKKAKDVVDPDTYRALEAELIVVKESRSLETGRLK